MTRLITGLTLLGLILLTACPAPAAGPQVSPAVTPGLSPRLDELTRPAEQQAAAPDRPVQIPRQRPVISLKAAATATIDSAALPDPLVDRGPNPVTTAPTVDLVFDGLTNADNIAAGLGATLPADPNGDVGPDHYVQLVNTLLAVYSKTGQRLAGPVRINALWTGTGGVCERCNDGDPIVVYDQTADRWVVSQFAVCEEGNYALCTAVSQTGDPTGAYNLYQFPAPRFPDYPKYGVWPDTLYNAYYIATNEDGGVGAYALERDQMLWGRPARMIRFYEPGVNFMLPSDLDGAETPPHGSPNYYYTFLPAGQWGAAEDSLVIYHYRPRFDAPTESSFYPAQIIPISRFNYTVCGYFNLFCIPQPDTTARLDPVSEWPMWRLQYRNFGVYQTLVGNFTVETTGDRGGGAGIRWFELMNNGGQWSMVQEGTHAPDSDYRFMGSAALDGRGNLALGYSVSGPNTYPSLRLAARRSSDLLGRLGPEVSLIEGGGSQTSDSSRWGDYSSLTVDPSDDKTFWYTGIYYDQTSEYGWKTAIGTFTVPD